MKQNYIMQHSAHLCWSKTGRSFLLTQKLWKPLLLVVRETGDGMDNVQGVHQDTRLHCFPKPATFKSYMESSFLSTFFPSLSLSYYSNISPTLTMQPQVGRVKRILIRHFTLFPSQRTKPITTPPCSRISIHILKIRKKKSNKEEDAGRVAHSHSQSILNLVTEQIASSIQMLSYHVQVCRSSIAGQYCQPVDHLHINPFTRYRKAPGNIENTLNNHNPKLSTMPSLPLQKLTHIIPFQ